jgi:hypothetical protein
MARFFPLIGLTFAAFLALLLVSCAIVPDKQFQSEVLKNPSHFCVNGLGSNADEECGLGRIRIRYSRYTIEYQNRGDGQIRRGARHDLPLELPDKSPGPTQKEVLDQGLRDAAAKGPIYLVVYVHGWHHNADPNDDNYLVFDNLLARVGDQLQRNGRGDHQLIGVYVGWQGEITRGNLLSVLSVGNRARAADDIAQGDLKADLRSWLAQLRDGNAHHPGNPNRALVIGHSLGGRILSTMMIPELAADPASLDDSWGATFATVNAAVDSSVFQPLFAQVGGSDRAPLWVNITSKDDWTTALAYPIAHLTMLLPSTPSILGHASESSIRTIGHDPRYITHTLDLVSLRNPAIRDDAAGRCIQITNPKEQQYPVDCTIAFPQAQLSGSDGFGNQYQVSAARTSKSHMQIKGKALAFDATRWWLDWPAGSADGETQVTLNRERNRDFKGVDVAGTDNKLFYATNNDDPGTSATVQLVNFRSTQVRPPRGGLLWNVYTTDNLIDCNIKPSVKPVPTLKRKAECSVGVHNGYVSTTLVRMLVELSLRDIDTASRRFPSHM